MTARRDSSDEPSHGSLAGRVLLGGAVVLALGATGVMVLSEQQQWLRLGIVGALWAALTGAFIAARYRKQLADREEDAQERQAMYELELEREVAARREYELEVQAETRRQVEEESRDDIAALRQELQGLRQTLESLMGGEFLVERYALRAESTRMRSLPDDGARKNLKRLPPAQVPAVIQEAETDLIERVVSEPRRPEPVAEEPALPQRAARARTEWPRPDPRVPSETKAEMSDRWFVPGALTPDQEEAAPATPAASGRRRAESRPREQWTGAIEADEWAPSWETNEPPARPAAKANGTAAAEEPVAALWRTGSNPHRHADPPSETGHEPANRRYADPPSEAGQLAASRYVDPASGYESAGSRYGDSVSGREPVNRRYADPPSEAGQLAASRYVDPASGYESAGSRYGDSVSGREPVNRRYADPPSEAGQPAASRHVEPVTGRDALNRRYADPPSDVGRYVDPVAESAGSRYGDAVSGAGRESVNRRYADPPSDVRQPAVSRYVDPASVSGHESASRYAAPVTGRDALNRRYADPPSDVGQPAVSRHADPAEQAGTRYLDPPAEVEPQPLLRPYVSPTAGGRRYADPASGYSTAGSESYTDPASGYRASASGYVDPASAYSAANGYEQPANRRYADPASGYADPPSGRRHAADQVNGDPGGGRRRRADDAPTWQESWQQQQNRNGGHARPDPDEPVDPPTGSHTAGRSVTELLATHGANPSPRRRRRRED